LSGAVTSVENVPFVENGVTKPLRVTVSDPVLSVLKRNKNAILPVDAIVQRRRRGIERAAAIPRSGLTALRPDRDDDVRDDPGYVADRSRLGRGIGVARTNGDRDLGGLISSTVLSLVVIPVAYTFVDRPQ
jgi:hypothetical protein